MPTERLHPYTDHTWNLNILLSSEQASEQVQGLINFFVALQVLAVQEKSGVFQGAGIWKMPTGTVNQVAIVFKEACSYIWDKSCNSKHEFSTTTSYYDADVEIQYKMQVYI